MGLGGWALGLVMVMVGCAGVWGLLDGELSASLERAWPESLLARARRSAQFPVPDAVEGGRPRRASQKGPPGCTTDSDIVDVIMDGYKRNKVPGGGDVAVPFTTYPHPHTHTQRFIPWPGGGGGVGPGDHDHIGHHLRLSTVRALPQSVQSRSEEPLKGTSTYRRCGWTRS